MNIRNVVLALLVAGLLVQEYELHSLRKRSDGLLEAKADGVVQLKVCSEQQGQQGLVLIGMTNDCDHIGLEPMAKFIVQSATRNHTVLRLYQRASSRDRPQKFQASAPVLELNQNGDGNFWEACDKANADGTCVPGHVIAYLDAKGVLVVKGVREQGEKGGKR